MPQKVHTLQQARGAASMPLLSRTVIGVSADWFLLADGPADRAKRALSCLLEPAVGDTVLVAQDDTGIAYILAVLTRSAPETGAVLFPGGGRLHAENGNVHWQANNIHVSGSQAIKLDTADLDVTAVRSQVRIRHCLGWFDSIEHYANRVSLSAKTVTNRLGRWFQYCVESFHQIDKLQETRASRMKTTVQGHHQLKAGHITSKAEGFVKIDGQKIDLG